MKDYKFLRDLAEVAEMDDSVTVAGLAQLRKIADDLEKLEKPRLPSPSAPKTFYVTQK